MRLDRVGNTPYGTNLDRWDSLRQSLNPAKSKRNDAAPVFRMGPRTQTLQDFPRGVKAVIGNQFDG